MTPEELKKLIERGPTEQMVTALAPLPDAERKKLAKGVIAIRKELSRRETERNRLVKQPPSSCPHCGKPLRTALARQCFECGKTWHEWNVEGWVVLDHWNHTSTTRLKLALMAVAPFSEVQRIRAWHVAPRYGKAERDRELLFQILTDRKPDWLSKWVDKELDDSTFGDWEFVRTIVRAGLCPKPQNPNYILRMVHGIRNHDNKKSLKDRLLDDPDLLKDEIWRIFELSPPRGTILHSGDITYVTRGDHPCFSWASTLLELANEGKLERGRLLGASLGSLLKNTEARNTTWFAKFHELLKPTVEERQTLQASYLHLLSHPVPGVVGLALDALNVLEKSRQLDAAGFAAAVPAVFHLRPKAQPLAAVKLLGRVAAYENPFASEIAAALLAGLAHPEPQLQQASIDLVGKLKDAAAATIAAQLPGLLDSLAPSVQEAARKLIGSSAQQAPMSDQTAENTDLLEEARQIASPWREYAGVDQILNAIQGSADLTAVPFDPMAVPRLDPAQRVEPIQTLDELIERLTVAVETLEDGIEFELLVDGLSRLCAQRPDDFEARVAPLLHRAEQVIPRGAVLGLPFFGLRAALIKLVRRWCDREVTETHEELDNILGFLDVRLRVLSLRLRKKEAMPLLACPTHRQGWIDARVMLERLTWFEQNHVEPSQHDFIQAILRLAPDRRAETLAATQALQGKYAPAFRYALGGPLPDALSAPLLVAAGRARTPFAALDETSIALTGPDAAQPARYAWDAHALTAAAAISPRWVPKGALVGLAVGPAVPDPERIRDMPTVLLHNWLVPFEFGFPGSGGKGVIHWVRTVWPSNLDSFFAVGVRLRAVEYMTASLFRLRAPFLEPLLDPDVPFTEVAQLLVALALAQAEPEATGLAVDALIELIRDGRCAGPELGDVLGRLFNADQIKLNRLAKHLDTVARASVLHTHVCAQIVQVACSQSIEIPKDVHHLLGPLVEWLTSLGQEVRKELRPNLEKTTTGKAGRLAKQLLALRRVPGRGARVFIEALHGRLERARRWKLWLEREDRSSDAESP